MRVESAIRDPVKEECPSRRSWPRLPVRARLPARTSPAQTIAPRSTPTATRDADLAPQLARTSEMMPSAAPAPARPLRRHTCLIARALHAVASHVPALNCSVALTVMCHACAGLAAVEHYIHISVSSSSRRLRRLAQPASQPPRSSCMRLSPCRAIARAMARSVASCIASRISPVQSNCQSHLASRIRFSPTASCRCSLVSQPCQRSTCQQRREESEVRVSE